ncbi:hypothetical protein B0H66DRAFT_580219 [Apodospora peruviana]|uniref:Putative gamma-glutamylcyclotransferase n=1 Tax=Apodospora peruviana TaxID=516989 RepID=A0AAE0IVM5_9PEZI|nr:hypothetical protein B0H66DRAFT_580219 [Apodospora peruviana]
MSDSGGAPTPPNITRGAPPPPPLPPQLVSARSPPQPAGPPKRSPYLEKLASMPEGYLLQRPKPRSYTYESTYYFFYGTLTKPDILQGVLGLDSEPVLRPAKIYGYELAKWGQYNALIDSKPGTVVTGHAYMVRSVEEEYKLAYYETNAYTLEPCAIYFTDGGGGADGEQHEDDNPTYGRTFQYAGDAQALKDGRFDWALWETQMGARLPPKWRNRGGKVAQELDEAVVDVEEIEREGAEA